MARRPVWIWSQADQERVHAMWKAGEKVMVIVATIGCPKSAFDSYRKARLAPRGSGGRPPNAYSDVSADRRDEIVRNMLSNSRTMSDIARAFGIDLVKAIGLVERIRREDRRKETHSIRPCMRCRNPFESEGKHNRICSSCKGFAAENPQLFGVHW